MNTQYPPLPAALIFNPASGAADDGGKFDTRLHEALAGANIQATTFEAKDDGELAAATAHARELGVALVIVCGGDGTIETVANGLVNSGLTLGILPAGTRNNLAASLNIPTDLAAAAALLRSGRRAGDRRRTRHLRRPRALVFRAVHGRAAHRCV